MIRVLAVHLIVASPQSKAHTLPISLSAICDLITGSSLRLTMVVQGVVSERKRVVQGGNR